ncbi:MAG: MBL fold metallo-hydrolase [Oscillospiraceae bacterium]|jgi:glyoxylase-like metal-dependent hydrolase (beta-lactamase superfamily II)|nr:MBL fold metallo-hydrolase [Oscillospiraceae bacterium]
MEIIKLDLGGNSYRFEAPLNFILDPANSYLIVSEQGNAAIVEAPDHADKILAELQSRNLTLKHILLTHEHFEHFFVTDELVRSTGAEVVIHKSAAPLLTDSARNAIKFIGALDYTPYSGALHTVEDGDVITLDELTIKVLHIPGHSDGSVAYIVRDALFSGDVLSHNAVGHYPKGAGAEMLRSLEKLAALPGNYNVYPGHWSATTLEHERANNLATLPLVLQAATVDLTDTTVGFDFSANE